MSGDSKIDSPQSIMVDSALSPSSPVPRRRKTFFLDHPRLVAVLLFLFDVCILLLLCTWGYSLRVGGGGGFFGAAMTENRFVQIFCYTASILTLIGISGAYRIETAYRTLNYVAEFILSVFLGACVGLFLIYVVLARYESFSPESRFGLVLASLIFLIPGLLTRLWISNKNQQIREQRPLLVFGKTKSLQEFVKNYHQTGLRNPIKLVNLAPQSPSVVQGPATEIGIADVPWMDVRFEYEAIVLMEESSSIDRSLMEKLVRLHFEDLPVFTLSAFYATRWRQVPVLNLDLTWALEQDFYLARRSYYRYIKDGFDLVFGGTLFLLALPFMLLVALIIKLDSKGPIIFTQERTGRDGKPFTLFKFRTMKVHVLSGKEDLYTREGDPRITRIGGFLRRTRLDELPQLLNIWFGNMSLIGPRAEWTKLVDKYEKEIPGYHLRHLVKPGITGWAQLNYPYGENLEDTIEKLKYDLYYIKHYSPILDLEIVLKTILAVVFFRGK
ncbi:MAG: exopolysaccharide biosynthesis polyprenyl glycosylphosphotransferase [Chthoniobacterales bacterium]